jgi:hypothetical protein
VESLGKELVSIDQDNNTPAANNGTKDHSQKSYEQATFQGLSMVDTGVWKGIQGGFDLAMHESFMKDPKCLLSIEKGPQETEQKVVCSTKATVKCCHDTDQTPVAQPTLLGLYSDSKDDLKQVGGSNGIFIPGPSHQDLKRTLTSTGSRPKRELKVAWSIGLLSEG